MARMTEEKQSVECSKQPIVFALKQFYYYFFYILFYLEQFMFYLFL